MLVVAHLLWQIWLVAAAPFPARYDYDEGVYAQTAAAAGAGHRLYASVFLSQPPVLIGVLTHVFGVFGPSLASARGTIIGFSIIWLVGLSAIAVCTAGARTAIWVVGIAATAPAFVAASHTVQMEGPAEALAALAVACGFGARGVSARDPARPDPDLVRWGIAGGLAGLAIMTKLGAATCLVPLAIVGGLERNTVRGVGASLGAFAVGALIAAAAAAAATNSSPSDLWRQAVVYHRAIAGLTPPDPGRTASLLLEFALHNWFLTATGGAGLAYTVWAWRRAAEERGRYVPLAAVTAWLAANLLAVLLWRPLWPHHLVILAAPLAILGAAAVDAGGRAQILPRGGVIAGALAAAWLIGLAGMALISTPETSVTLRAGSAYLAETVPAGDWVIADDPMVAFLAGRQVPPEFCDTSQTRMRIGWLTERRLTEALRDARVRGVVLWRGTFRERLPGFVAAARAELPRRWTDQRSLEILTR